MIFSAIYVVVSCWQVKNTKLLSFAQKANLGYVQVKLRDRDKSWALHKAFKIRVKTLRSWTQEKSPLTIWNNNGLERTKHHG